MNIKLVKLLTAVCAVLLVLIIVEWIASLYSRSRLLESVESTVTTGGLDAEMPSIKLKDKPEESYVDLVERPLFIKGRRPVEEHAAGNEATAVSSDKLDWQLNGVYTGKKGLSALFSRVKIQPGKDNYRKLTINEDLDGWKISEIHNDKVILTLGDEPLELLLRKPKPKEMSKNPNAPKPPISKTQSPGRKRPGHPPIPSPQADNNQEAEENSDNE